jgi:hypothetical protein
MNNNNENFIIIGKYKIYKNVIINKYCYLDVKNMETNVNKVYYIYELFNLLKREKLNSSSLHDYLDNITYNKLTKY